MSKEAANETMGSPIKVRATDISSGSIPPIPKRSSWAPDYGTTRSIERSSERPPSSLPPNEGPAKEDATVLLHKTPTQLKRHTLPVTLSISPNLADSSHPISPSSTTPATSRVHMPVSTVSEPSSMSPIKQLPDYAISSPTSTATLKRRPQSASHNISDHSDILETTPFPLLTPHTSGAASSTHNLRPTSRSNEAPTLSSPYALHRSSSLSRSSGRSSVESLTSLSQPTPASVPASSVMSPTPYRSSYMTNKKSGIYGSSMVVGRKFGRHLPRIASGDGNDYEDLNIVDDQQKREEEEAILAQDKRKHEREEKRRRWNLERDRQDSQAAFKESQEPIAEQELIIPGTTGTDDVQGLRGRLRLSKTSAPSSPALTTPLPSARLNSGLWADTQRHLLQAYEYLCHVGEAQQWIEGCLGEELGFGVVEMEEGLRNGVVLAKLVRELGGEVRRIYNVRFIAHIPLCIKLPPGA